jgi:hypothetical protein
MPWEELEPTIPASERAKTVHALDLSATVTDIKWQKNTIKEPPQITHEC